jgi:hypothetical protein
VKVAFLGIAVALLMAVQLPVRAAPPLATDHIRVYEPGTIVPDAYTVVKRLWTETWRSAFILPAFPDAAAAVAAMKQEAAKIGADAVTNVMCLPDATLPRPTTKVYCHGQLIRMKN